MSKHACLIMAHDEFGVLKKSLTLMDHPRNDIYVHVDKKVKDFNPQDFYPFVKKGQLFFTQRTKVTWGSYSQINAELLLLKSAVKNKYEYYHLLSGSDLPLKSMAEMHNFFDQRKGKELITFNKVAYETKNFHFRIKEYYFLQELMGKNRSGIINFINKVLLKSQNFLKVNRMKNSHLDFRKGLNWFSITHDLAQYVLLHEPDIKKQYKFTIMADEIFLQTLVWNSHFRDAICEDMTRLTKKGRPYIFRIEDFDFLIQSKAFWGRKFSEKVDPYIIEKIYKHLHG